jgi:hypothetical protein
MLKIATVTALLGVALAGTAEGKTKIINPWNNLGGDYRTCPYLEGRWPYCDVFYQPRIVIVVPGHGEDHDVGRDFRAPERTYGKVRRHSYGTYDGSP